MWAIVFYIASFLALAVIFPFIPVPNFLTNLPTYTMPSEIMFFLEPFKFEMGLAIMASAYSARFIRKILVKA